MPQSTLQPSLRLDTFSYTFYVDNTIVTRGKKSTYLSATAPAAATTLSVQSIVGFNSLSTSSGQIICVGELGNEKTEIIKTSSSTAPSGTTVTLAAGLLFDHPQDTRVYIVDWDQFALSRSTGISSQKSTLTTMPTPIQADQLESIYRDSANTTGYGFVEFRETIGGTYSKVSDYIPYIGFDDNTVFSIKQRALDSIGERVDQDHVSHEFLNNALWQGRREYHQSIGKRPFRRKYNTSIGTVATGIYRIALPIDVERPYTAENIYGVRIGTSPNIPYYDKKLWDQDYQGSAHSTLNNSAGYTVGDKDLYVTDTRNFTIPASGGTASVTLEDDPIVYNAVGVSSTAGTLRISTQGKFSHANGSDVWQGITSGLPQNFTVFADPGGSAFVYFSSPISTLYVNQDIFSDYYRTVVDQDSDNDLLDEPDYDMYVPYLAWRMKKKRNKGLVDQEDPDYQKWIERKLNSLAMEYAGTEVRISPNVDHLPIPP